MEPESPFRREREGSVSWLTFDRPEKLNAMTRAFFSEVREFFEQADGDPEVRVVGLKAEGRSFTAGIDLMDLSSMVQGNGADFREALKHHILSFQESFSAVERCRKPVIAAVHGHCIGGGVDLLCACDIRMASRDALFSIRETRMAIIPDLGTLQRLPAIIGQGWFRELALTGRDFSAEEALRMGFITRLCESREELHREAAELARQISELPPLTVQGIKDVSLVSRDQGVYPGLAYVAQMNAAQLPSEDLMEAFQAFMERRKPVFKGK